MNQYRRGSDFERKVAEHLTTNGYLVVRAAGSHGHADLVALKPGQVLLVQCKLTGASAVRPGEWNGFYAAAVGVGAVPLIAWRPARGQIGFLRMTATKTGVQGVRPPCVPWVADEIAGPIAEPASSPYVSTVDGGLFAVEGGPR